LALLPLGLLFTSLMVEFLTSTSRKGNLRLCS
jgi:hypothetical protein